MIEWDRHVLPIHPQPSADEDCGRIERDDEVEEVRRLPREEYVTIV